MFVCAAQEQFCFKTDTISKTSTQNCIYLDFSLQKLVTDIDVIIITTVIMTIMTIIIIIMYVIETSRTLHKKGIFF